MSVKAKLLRVEHHLAHISSSYLVSPFNEAICLTVDGFGDLVSTMRAIGNGTNIKIIDWVEYPHSLGVFYTALTQYLGFWNYGDEYKIMGLSAYGTPVYFDEVKKIIKFKKNGLFKLNTSYFVHAEKGVEMVWDGGVPTLERLFSDKVVQIFGEPRNKDEQITEKHMNLAASIQETYENAFFNVLNSTHSKFPNIKNLVLAGGCVQNSLANGKIFKNTNFKDVYIPPAPYDAGLSIGAAMFAWHKKSKEIKRFVMSSPYLGPSFNKDDIKSYLSTFKMLLDKCRHEIDFVSDEQSLCKKVAQYIADGKIVGWYQGRTEFGPRALGNRSILADPRSKNMKDTLNKRIKKREWFRPFAPSILEDHTDEWFEDIYPVPFMEKVYVVKNEKRELIPAVCNIDGTGRLQTVSKQCNSRYYTLIKEFNKLTGVPILLNTSFNDNEPIVNSPADAINCFLNTHMDVLVLEDYIITKGETSTQK